MKFLSLFFLLILSTFNSMMGQYILDPNPKILVDSIIVDDLIVEDMNTDGRSDFLLISRTSKQPGTDFNTLKLYSQLGVFFQDTNSEYDSYMQIDLQLLPNQLFNKIYSYSDFNNDGRKDILGNVRVKVSQFSYYLSIGIFYQKDSLTFDTLKTIITSLNINYKNVKVADMNNDTLLDIVLNSVGKMVPIFYQDSLRNFNRKDKYINNGYANDAMVVCDINNDGLNDVIFNSTSTSNRFFVYLQIINSDSFAIGLDMSNYGYDPMGFIAKDINKDGKVDLVVYNTYLGAVIWLQNTLGGLISKVAIKAPNNAGYSLEDINCDGFLEFIINSNISKVYDYNKVNGYLKPDSFDSPALNLYDVNNDERLDRLQWSSMMSNIMVYKNKTLPPVQNFIDKKFLFTKTRKSKIYHTKFIQYVIDDIDTFLYFQFPDSSDKSYYTKIDSSVNKKECWYTLDSTTIDSVFSYTASNCTRVFSDTLTVSIFTKYDTTKIDTFIKFAYYNITYYPSSSELIDLKSNFSIQVYPTLFSNELNVEFNNIDYLYYRIINSFGFIIDSGILPKGKNVITTTLLYNGIYLMSLFDNNKNEFNIKLVK